MKEYEQGKRDHGQAPLANTIKCYKCWGLGHMARECHKNVICFSYKEVGHVRSEFQVREEQTDSQGRETEQEPAVCSVYVNQTRNAATTAVRGPFNWSPNPAFSMESPL